jgi:hypothetical protein
MFQRSKTAVSLRWTTYPKASSTVTTGQCAPPQSSKGPSHIGLRVGDGIRGRNNTQTTPDHDDYNTVGATLYLSTRHSVESTYK